MEDESFEGDTSAFVTGDDFIGFDIPSAGPSRSPSPDAASTRPPSASSPKGKSRAYDREGEATDASTDKPKNRSEKRKESKRKGKGKEPEPKRPKVDEGDRVGPRNLKEERKAAERAAPWAEDVDWEGCTNPAEMLNDEIHAFYRLMSPTRGEYEVRKTMIELISYTIRREWRDAEVSAFGSWQTQMYLPMGDIDLVVSNPRFTESSKVKLLHELARIIRHSGITNTVAAITRARVPIIKFVTTDGHINVDISLNQGNGVSAAHIMTHYLDALPGARELILVLKSYLSQRSMNEVFTGGLGSYSAICLVLSFLQTHPKVRNSEIDPHRNLGVLLVEFFELYGRNYNYDDVTIAVRRGGGYCTKRSRGWNNHTQPYLLSIQDPQDPVNDVSKTSFGIRQVKLTLAGAYELLTARLFEAAEVIATRAKSKRDREPLDPQQMTILGKIMGVTKETNKFRREIEYLATNRILQRKLADAIARYGPIRDDETVHPKHRDTTSAHLSSAITGVRSSSPDASLPSDDDAAVGAILVDDDEDNDMDSSNSEFELSSISGMDEPLPRPGKNRYMSVSEDEVEESRYEIATNKRVNANGNGKSQANGNGHASSSSNRAASVPATKPSREPTPRLSKSKPASRIPSPQAGATAADAPSPRDRAAERERLKRKQHERKAFWASKGVLEASEESEGSE